MTPRTPFGRTFVAVSAAHAGLVLLLCVASLFSSCARRREPLVIPTTFLLELPVEPAAAKGVYDPGEDGARRAPERPKDPEPPGPTLRQEATKKPPPPPKKTEKPRETARKPPEPPKETKKIDVSDKRIRRAPASPSTVKPQQRVNLTPAEIKRLLELGATPSARARLSEADLRRAMDAGLKFSANGVPLTGDMLYKEIIRQTMYNAWNQPASRVASGLNAQVEIGFASDGTILRSRLVRSSGNASMDESALQAVSAVRRVSGLPSSFLAQTPTVVIAFELTDQMM